jgi:hypothetical protein
MEREFLVACAARDVDPGNGHRRGRNHGHGHGQRVRSHGLPVEAAIGVVVVTTTVVVEATPAAVVVAAAVEVAIECAVVEALPLAKRAVAERSLGVVALDVMHVLLHIVATGVVISIVVLSPADALAGIKLAGLDARHPLVVGVEAVGDGGKLGEHAIEFRI